MQEAPSNGKLAAVSMRAIRELVTAGTVPDAYVVGADEGLLVMLQLGKNEWYMGGVRGGRPRYFQSFDGAASALQQVGIRQFGADTSNWSPKKMRDRQTAVESEGEIQSEAPTPPVE